MKFPGNTHKNIPLKTTLKIKTTKPIIEFKKLFKSLIIIPNICYVISICMISMISIPSKPLAPFDLFKSALLMEISRNPAELNNAIISPSLTSL